MHVSPVYNISLLNKIRDITPCSLKQLKDAYAPEQPGMITGRECNFESNLKTLEDMGCIAINEGIVSFIRMP